MKHIYSLHDEAEGEGERVHRLLHILSSLWTQLQERRTQGAKHSSLSVPKKMSPCAG
jgi:hypothetical protein